MTPNQLKARIAAAAGEPKVMLSQEEAEGLLAALTPAVATSPGSPPDLEGLGELLAKATPGPWVRRELKPYEWSNPQSFVCAPEALIDNGMGRTYATQILGEDDYPTKRADEDLLVVVKAALPWLLDRAREAERAEALARKRGVTVLELVEQGGAHLCRAEAAEARLSALTAERDRAADALLEIAGSADGQVMLTVSSLHRKAIDVARQALQSDGRGE